jgi:acyl-CoA thioesterase-1
LAYPAQLEAMLRASGRNVRVYNAGIYGDTTTGMLSRVDSVVLPGTKVVILQAGTNDYRLGLSPAKRAANIAAIQNKLRARGIKLVLAEPAIRTAARQYPHPDRIHTTPAGHRFVAQRLLPQVLAGLR